MQQLATRRDAQATAADAVFESQHRRKLLIAILLLLAAITILLIRNRQYWFGSEETPAAAATEDNWNPATPMVVPKPAVEAPAPPVKAEKHVVAHAPAAPASGSSIVATDRKVLQPLNVEVVAGDKHVTLRSGSDSVKLDTNAGFDEAVKGTVTPAAERARIAPEVTYPLLGPQMKVQGSVLLQAIIGVDGAVQSLKVISGPAILSAAAREAVMHWRFKPYLENGRPVETQARVTVNFAIKVFDDVARVNGPSLSSNGF